MDRITLTDLGRRLLEGKLTPAEQAEIAKKLAALQAPLGVK